MSDYFLVIPCLRVDRPIPQRNHLDNSLDKRVSGDVYNDIGIVEPALRFLLL